MSKLPESAISSQSPGDRPEVELSLERLSMASGNRCYAHAPARNTRSPVV